MAFPHDPAARSMRSCSGQLCFLSSSQVPIGRGHAREFYIWVHATPDGRLLLTRRTNLYKGRVSVKSPEIVQMCFADSVAEIIELLHDDPVEVPPGLMASIPTGIAVPEDIRRIMYKPIKDWSRAELTKAGMYIRDNRPR